MCPKGTTGVNCSSICTPPTHGDLCSQTCNCSNSSCHHVYGCTGMSFKYQDFFSFEIECNFQNKQTNEHNLINPYRSVVFINCFRCKEGFLKYSVNK